MQSAKSVQIAKKNFVATNKYTKYLLLNHVYTHQPNISVERKSILKSTIVDQIQTKVEWGPYMTWLQNVSRLIKICCLITFQSFPDKYPTALKYFEKGKNC